MYQQRPKRCPKMVNPLKHDEHITNTICIKVSEKGIRSHKLISEQFTTGKWRQTDWKVYHAKARPIQISKLITYMKLSYITNQKKSSPWGVEGKQPKRKPAPFTIHDLLNSKTQRNPRFRLNYPHSELENRHIRIWTYEQGNPKGTDNKQTQSFDRLG